ncbi:hypothetical protein H6504_02400 [Candidatus Woesearchaeota archaeon]|nr:hypothetical protein [Candidatus Woesearchaeota archaeon]
MNETFKRLLTSARIIILLLCLVFAVVAINPNPGASGVAIRSVDYNSSADIAGIDGPKPNSPPRSREVIIAIDNKPITSMSDYYEATSDLYAGQFLNIITSQSSYTLVVKEHFMLVETNETEEQIITDVVPKTLEINGKNVTFNQSVNRTITVPLYENVSLGIEDLGLSVYDAPSTNIRKGLDLQGGTRVLLQPEEKLSEDKMEVLLLNLQERLNVYGLSDIVVRESGELFSDNQYITVEIAGANEDEVKNLLSTQGKFEAKIGKDVVFTGGDGDITYVCRSSDCSGIDPYRGCGALGDGQYACTFRFSIALKPEAAERQANLTKNLAVVSSTVSGGDGQYLNQSLDLYLDDIMVDTLNIGSDLRGRAVTDIQISGSGAGLSEAEARVNALANMKQLQTVLVTGSLPTKLEIVKTDNLSPQLGSEFIKSALMIGVLAILAVASVVYIRYRRIEVFVPMVITMVSEVTLLLGMAALIGWNIDLAAVAGIIIAVGTGIDHQIVIADESLRKKNKYVNWQTKLKNAFFIIMAAYFTTAVAMLPLYFAGAGILKGFAITTLMGITFGVLITRPAFGSMMEILIKEK